MGHERDRESMSTDRVRVFPAKGRIVRDEFTLEPIPAEGKEVKRTRLVERRILDGDLLEHAPDEEHTEAKPQTTRERYEERG
jgi:hypothetical protein